MRVASLARLTSCMGHHHKATTATATSRNSMTMTPFSRIFTSPLFLSGSVNKRFSHTHNNNSSSSSNNNNDNDNNSSSNNNNSSSSNSNNNNNSSSNINVNQPEDDDFEKIRTKIARAELGVAEANRKKAEAEAEAEVESAKSMIKAEIDVKLALAKKYEEETKKAEEEGKKAQEEAKKAQQEGKKFEEEGKKAQGESRIKLMLACGLLVLVGDYIYCELPVLNEYRVLRKLEERSVVSHQDDFTIGGAPFINRTSEFRGKDPIRTMQRVIPVAVFGHVGVGKTALMERFCSEQPYSLYVCLRTNQQEETQPRVPQTVDSLKTHLDQFATSIGIPSRRPLIFELVYKDVRFGENLITSNWDRISTALQQGLNLFAKYHPDKYASVVLDEVTFLLQHDNDAPAVAQHKNFMLRELIQLAVMYGVDKNIAKFYLCSSTPLLAMDPAFRSHRRAGRFEVNRVYPMSFSDRMQSILNNPEFEFFKSHTSILEKTLTAVSFNQRKSVILLNDILESYARDRTSNLDTICDQAILGFEEDMVDSIREFRKMQPETFECFMSWMASLNLESGGGHDQRFKFGKIDVPKMPEFIELLQTQGLIYYLPVGNQLEFTNASKALNILNRVKLNQPVAVKRH